MTSAANGPRVALKGQYIKDLSFENPRAPQSFLAVSEAPKIDLRIDAGAQRLQQTIFELSLSIGVRALVEGKTLFLVDLSYAGAFEVSGIPEDQLERVVLIDCAHVLFPFARRVIADVTRDGGFPPLLLEPIDFHALYQQQRASQAAS